MSSIYTVVYKKRASQTCPRSSLLCPLHG